MSAEEETKPETKIEENKQTAELADLAAEGTKVDDDFSVKPTEIPAASSSTEGDKQLPQWREKAGEIINHSSIKIKEAATVASTAVVGAAGVTGTKVKATWESTKEGWQTSVQPRMTATWQSTKDGWQSNVKPKVEAAARAVVEAGVLIKKNILETKEKVASAALHKRIAEATRNSIEKSRSFLVKMEILPPGLNPKAVFGVPFEKVVAYQPADKPVPQIVIACVEFIESEEGLSVEFLFDDEGDPTFVTKLMKTFERDDQAVIPPGIRPQDAAQVLLAFFRCLPEPILTFHLYDDFVGLKEEEDLVPQLKPLFGKLPPANYATLERVFKALDKVAKSEASGKMNAESLAREWAPVLLWKKGGGPVSVSPGIPPPPPHQNPVSGEKDEVKAPDGTEKESSQPEETPLPVVDEQRLISKAVEVLITDYSKLFQEKESSAEA